MNKSFGSEDARIERFVTATYAPEDEVLREIRERSLAAGLPEIQLTALDALHLEVLVRAVGARRAVEIGTLGGYSGVAILRGLTSDGVLDTFEIDADHARVAEETFRRAGFAGRARIHLGPALRELGSLDTTGAVDFCFIDADKEGYPAYLDWAARHLRRGGIVVADNAFLFGQIVADVEDSPPAALVAMRAFHQRLARGGEFRATVLPTGEGLAVGIRL